MVAILADQVQNDRLNNEILVFPSLNMLPENFPEITLGLLYLPHLQHRYHLFPQFIVLWFFLLASRFIDKFILVINY